ncbi:integrase arm-type DNA-binding domain-containing protein [Neorhizobium galegae]|uniref:tyrosine-type recombinase/integrase n=1 Tax=Neorhizobium galegae TaxID=399 RepID=UPI00210342C1|nr:integrase arm-type DNA-binding domain-containing protein [Neorhizobium galegae]MCQ1775352.1 integrase arm-type DNA-binding domain-containing protein [Neorhizobium galegae]MCQ1799898.1 integrase arm-type DNA-binding domain-containing protein [Neorhizobium galegae]
MRILSAASILATVPFMVEIMVANRLTDTKIKAIKEPGVYADGAGLYLRMHAAGSKSWFFIYTRAGKRREIGLGGFAGTAPVSLAIARRKADDLRALLAEGRDPHAEKTVRKSGDRTFRKIAERFIADRDDWQAHTRKEWERHLFEHAVSLGDRPIGDIDTDMIEAALRPIWEKKPATGQRVRGKLEAVLDYATAKRMRTGDNPARWSGHLEHILAKASRVTGSNHAALSHENVPSFLAVLGERALERLIKFIVLTAVRSGEARLADWSEFDLPAKTWTIPKERTKTGKELVVPLTDEALAALPEAGEEFVFVEDGEPFSIMAMPNWIAKNKPGVTVHGFRSAFRDYAGDCTDFPREIAEMALGHKVGNAVEQAYRRGDALQKRRELMQAWAEYCLPSPKS